MPIVALPFVWLVAVEAAEATAAILAAAIAAVAIRDAVKAVDDAAARREESTGATSAAADRTCATCAKKCPACVPPAGSIRVERVDLVPPSRPHAPCPGDHAHLIQMNQAPYPDCRCFWNKARPDVICLGPGDALPHPMK